MKSKTVVIGLVGSTLDQNTGPNRWNRWRPSVALGRHEDLIIDRFDLLYQRRFKTLARVVAGDIRSVSPETETVLHQVEFADPWDFEEVFEVLHEFGRAYPFNPEEEDYLVHITTGTHVAQICLFLLTESRLFPARLIQSGPPLGREKSRAGRYSIIDLDLSRYDRLAQRFDQETRDDISFLKSGIETRNKAFNDLIERIEKVSSRTDDPILLSGPTGAGKSHLARRIFDLKKARRRLAGEFVEVNCATIRGDGAMSALFGHKKGSFTGAVSDRSGLLRAADEGLLFLDEVGELGLDEQTMLLRAVEEKRFLPVGSDQEVSSRFQLICGSNRDLAAEVSRGRFREDLLARINLWTFALPGLAERPEDVEPNLDYELERHASRTGTHVRFNKEARAGFLKFACGPQGVWKANFRDLGGAVTRMAALAPGGRITVEVMEEEVERLRSAWRSAGADSDLDLLGGVLGREEAENLDLFDRAQLAAVIRVCRRSSTLSEAGRRLFAVSRRAKAKPNDADRLRKYLGRFGLDWRDLRG